MSVAALCLGLVAFVGVLRLLHAERVAGGIVTTTQEALSVMANRDIAEEDKEAQVQRASLKLLGGFFRIASIGVAAIAASVLVVWSGAALEFYNVERAIAVALGWPFLLGSTVAAIALWVALDRLRERGIDADTNEEVPYSSLDKALHDFAFASPDRQIQLGKLETKLHRRRIQMSTAQKPVFITSLPRAGTTILLEGLATLPQFASATYQHMPFTLSPLMWGAFSRAFRRSGDKSERAHGDGIEVGMDSPEAFEEMLWMAFWPKHFRPDHISLWTPEDENPAFETFFRTHLAKVVATKPGATRYISKNNANIARLGLLERLFPEASIVIPIRNPRAQVKSLMTQHKRFAELHAREPFARRYMEGIGHFEFGEALRPLAFAPQEPRGVSPNHVDFWLRYWIDAYSHVLATAGPRTVFLDYDALCTHPVDVLADFAAAIELQDPHGVAAMAEILRPPRPAPDLQHASPDLLLRADTLHAELRSQAIGHPQSPAGKVAP